MPSNIVSLRMRPQQRERVQHLARRRGKSVSETLVGLVEEGLRAAEYPLVQFRDSSVGREAYVMGTSTAVWEVAWLARFFGGDADAVAGHLNWPLARVRAALNYGARFPEEIQDALEDMERDPRDLQAMLPSLRVVTVGDD